MTIIKELQSELSDLYRVAQASQNVMDTLQKQKQSLYDTIKNLQAQLNDKQSISDMELLNQLLVAEFGYGPIQPDRLVALLEPTIASIKTHELKVSENEPTRNFMATGYIGVETPVLNVSPVTILQLAYGKLLPTSDMDATLLSQWMEQELLSKVHSSLSLNGSSDLVYAAAMYTALCKQVSKTTDMAYAIAV